MQLHEIVRINETGLVANAVSFELMDDPEKNLRLCQGFVFNYDADPRQIKTSTIGVLDALRRSFHSPSEPNVHLMVQDYGKGKSHFALAIANFFQKPYDSPEVQGVLQQVEFATSGNALLEGLRSYKQRGRHLVVCLSGDKPIDLRKHFLQTLRRVLDQEGVTGAIAQRICQRPIQYLERLNPEQRAIADSYLERIGSTEGDVATLIQLLRDDNYQVVSSAKEVFYALVGDYPDWEADVDVEAILHDLVTRLCMGADAPYQGILILFDELYNYLQLWASDPVRAGSTALQNITNVCERFTGRVALVGFAQRKLSRVIPSKNVEDYKRLVTRLELLPSTYEPAASLELVLDGLLSQLDQTAAWQDFRRRWETTLREDSRVAFEQRTANYYSNRNWTLQKYRDRVGLGCFPLHPLTVYLLCNLDFTQGRTAIQFVQDEVKRFIAEQPIEKNGTLNYIYPISLIDAFESNFANPQVNPEYPALFANYSLAANKIKTSADADPGELSILKAIFLFHASGTKLAKPDREKHEEILCLLAGLTPAKAKLILEKLWKAREVIHHNPATNTYDFYSNGIDPDALRRRIRDTTANIETSIGQVEAFCQNNINNFVGAETTPSQFVEDYRLRSEDWRFQNKVLAAHRLKSALLSDQTLRGIDGSGLVAYAIAETSEEANALRKQIEELLAKSPIKGQVVVAIAIQPAANLARLIIEFEYAEKMSVTEFGAALTQIREQYKKQIQDSAKELFSSCIYFCHIQEKIATSDRTDPAKMVSAVLSDLYPYIPPVEKIDKLSIKKGTKGGEIIGYVAKRLLENDLRPQAFPQQSYANTIDPVFVNVWGLLRKTSAKYGVTTPTHSKVIKAWNEISEMMALGEESEKTVDISKIWKKLSSPPYGYNEYTFTILFAGWLSLHRSELWLRGCFGIPQKKAEHISVKEEAIAVWANTNILDKPKEFVNEWINKGHSPKLIRRRPAEEPEVPPQVDYDQAQQFVQKIALFLESGTHDAAKVAKHRQKSDLLTAAINRLNNFLESTSRAEDLLKASLSDQPDIEPFVQLCRDLQEPIPVIAENGQTVSPTEQQQGNRQHIRQALIERIGQVVEAESERCQQLRTEVECGAYKSEIQRLQNQVRQIVDLPSRHIDALQDALQAANIRLSEIDEQRRVEECLTQIQQLYNALSNNATQDEYHRVQAEIEKLVEGVPAAKDTDTYRNTINTLSEKQDGLILQISQWEDQYSSTIQTEQAVQLRDKINRQHDRFTEPASRERLHDLLNNLRDRIIEGGKEEEYEKKLQNILIDAERKLQDAKTLKNLADAFQAYQNLSQLTLPASENVPPQEDKQKQLDTLKREGYKTIAGKFNQIVEACNRKLNQKQEYEQLKPILQKCQSLVVSHEGFSEIKNSLEEAERNLEAQYLDLQKRLQDTRTMQAIRQYTLAKANTIHLCEESIKSIEGLRNELRNAEQFIPEVDRLISGFQGKISDYCKNLHSLGDRLLSIDDSDQLNALRADYARLDLVFKDSTEYAVYLQLQEAIRLVEIDLGRVHKLEVQYQQSQAIATCDELLESIGDEQINLNDLERFQPRLLKIEEGLRTKKQSYLDQLDQLQNKVANLETLKEANKLRQEAAEKAACYRNSSQQEKYEAIAGEISLLVNLFQIADAQKVDTVQACQAEIERLTQWRNSTESITPNVQTHFDRILANLERSRQSQQEKRQRAANSWLEGLIKNYETNVVPATEPSERLNAANQVLKLIRTQRSHHDEFLDPAQQQKLEQLAQNCSELQRQSAENQIITLFQELTRDQKVNLYQKLAEYLSNTTEEFNG